MNRGVEKEIVKILERVATKRSFHKVFEDWLKWIVWFLSGAKIEEYKKVLDSYTAEEGKILWEALNKFIELQEENQYYDILWSIYEQYITHWEHWQFFTPYNVVEFMTRITLWEVEKGKKITISDPASGSWRMLLLAGKMLKDRKKDVLFMAVDIDERCFLMTAINLQLHWLTWIVFNWNSLTWKVFKVLATMPLLWSIQVPYIIDITDKLLFNWTISYYNKRGFFNKRIMTDKIQVKEDKIDVNYTTKDDGKKRIIKQLSLF